MQAILDYIEGRKKYLRGLLSAVENPQTHVQQQNRAYYAGAMDELVLIEENIVNLMLALGNEKYRN